MRIDVITVITGLDEEALEIRRKAIEEYASPGTKVRLVVTGHGPASVESQAEMELTAPGILRCIVESADSGASAIVIWGGHDPSLAAARELVSVPVVAPGMASMLLAASLADRFALLVQLPNALPIARRQVRDLGLETRCSSIRSIDVPVLDIAKESGYGPLASAAIQAIDDGADAVCLGCMAMTIHADRLAADVGQRRPGALVINPGRAAIRWAEMVAGLGLSQSPRSYLRPPKPVEL